VTFLTRLSPAKRAVLSIAGIVAVASTVAAAAIVYQGFTSTQVALNDGGVWVVNAKQLMLGHLNFPSQTLDSGLKSKTSDFTVLQHDSTVLLHDEANSTLATVNPASVVVDPNVARLPAGAKVALGAATVVVVAPGSGKVWVTSSGSADSFSQSSPTALVLGKGGVATVGADGTVYGASPAKGKLYTVRVDSGGTVTSTTDTDLAGVTPGATLTVTAVGTQAVVLDSTTNRLFTGSGSPVNVAAHSVLQQSGPASDSVLVATSTTLIEQPLAGGTPTRKASGGSGTPAAPVFLDGCAYAAWAGSGRYLRDCVGTANDVAATVIVGVTTASAFVFRVNRDVVVLNDITGGNVWMLNKSNNLVRNWQDIEPATNTSTNNSNTKNPNPTPPDRSQPNRPPVAQDDTFGVRAGRTTILPVLDNDSDPDGDVMTAALDGPNPSAGTIATINDGAQLQLTAAPNATGTSTFKYTVSDGRGGEAQATVTLTVSPAGSNKPPVERRVATVLVEQGATVRYNALPDWNDPDGDVLFLKGATSTGGDQVQFSPDGTITFAALSQNTGLVTVPISVSDGIASTAGTVSFDVRPVGSLKPQPNADHVSAKVGQQVTVSPLLNDVSPSGLPLRLAQVSSAVGAQIVPDAAAGTFSFISTVAQTYYLTYIVTDGPNQAIGLVRIDVTPSAPDNSPPVAVRDVVYLPSGGNANVDVLANDNDPAGGVLVVQSIQNPAASGVAVVVLQHRILRVSDQAGISAPTTFTYTVSDGTKSATADVEVIPVPTPRTDQPPVAAPDSVTVRANDYVTIPVLSNDTHADGTTLSLAPGLAEPLDTPSSGTLFVSGNDLRFQAGPATKATTVHATYVAVDNLGRSSAAQVTINILPATLAKNDPPQPRGVTARALAGTTVRIPIPLDGIDPNGDSVTLIGQATAPTKGRIVAVGQTWLDYLAYPTSSGTDMFTYQVADHLGAIAVGQIMVGIAPANAQNQPPVAVNDTLLMRPGHPAFVDVLANDSDPDGDPLTLVTGGLTVPSGITATISDGGILVEASQSTTQKVIQYTVSDSHGSEAVGTLRVTVDPNAPLLPPNAQDDVVSWAQAAGKQHVDVAVLNNDSDPNGTANDLSVSLSGPGAANAQVVGKTVRVTLEKTPQEILYTDTNSDGLKTSAFILVPGLSDQYPSLKADAPAVTVKSGQPITLNLGQFVIVAPGKSPRVTTVANVTAAHSNGSPLVKDQSTLVYTSAAGYIGPDSLSVEVTDGTGPDDPHAHKATIVIPVTVVPATTVAPTLLGSIITVSPGETATSIDLQKLTTDANPGRLSKVTYKLLSVAPTWLTTNLKGRLLSVAAATAASKGSTVSLQVQATDGTAPPATATITVNVAASSRPLPVAVNLTKPDAVQNQTYTFDVFSPAFNPFPSKQLRLLDVHVASGTGTIAPPSGAGQVKVATGGTFFGTLIVSYRIGDATNDPSREVTGTITLTVAGKPAAPLTPSVQSISDRTVVLTWAAPSGNGSPITGYTVQAAGFQQKCVSTSCTLTGLTNNTTYGFTVVATNKVGDSPASPVSAPARPDAVPNTPAAPALAFGDGSLSVSWVAPQTHGSAVQSYTLQISPAPASGGQKSGLTGNSYTWTGLTNGTSYTVQVEAFSLAPSPSPWSAPSAVMVPAGVPSAPGTPTVSKVPSVGTQAQLTVSWIAPTDNGAPISAYTLNETQNGATIAIPVAGGQTSQTVNVAASASSYTFSIVATNKAGNSSPSPTSAPLRAVNAPGAPSSVSASPGNNAVTVTYTAAAPNGASASELSYEYSVNGGAWRNDWVSGGSGTSGVIGNGQVNNNGSYTISVRATSTIGGAGPSSAPSGSVAPFGPPNQPGAGATGGGAQVNLQWGPPAPNGKAIVSLEISVDGGAYQAVGVSSGNENVGTYSQTHSITVRATDSVGQTSTNSASATSGPAPVTSWSIPVGAARTCAQDQLVTTRYSPSGPSCISPGQWIAANTVITTTCYADSSTLSTNGDYRWYWIPNMGLYVSQNTMKALFDTTTPGGMPRCP
jgi:hypothetical protein